MTGISSRLTRADMLRLFDLLDAELASEDVQGELYLVGGWARSSTTWKTSAISCAT